MTSIINKLYSMGLIKPPHFVVGGIQYETIMGSEAYGVATDFSDKDIYGFVIPPKEIVFPHLSGHIEGFGKQVQRFEQYQEHHIKTETVEYDLNIYNIVKYFQLCMENNPNMIDSLFTDTRCVLHSTKIAQEVRDNRRIFLHRGCWHKFKGYSYSQLSKIPKIYNKTVHCQSDFSQKYLDTPINIIEEELDRRKIKYVKYKSKI